MASKIKFRRDTAANWTSVNPTLGIGEPGYETDTGKLKIGTGTLAWQALPYFDDKENIYTSIASNIIPSTDSVYDLGSPSKQWRRLYVSNNTIYIGGVAVGVDGSGNLTVGGTQPAISALKNGSYSISVDADGHLVWPNGQHIFDKAGTDTGFNIRGKSTGTPIYVYAYGSDGAGTGAGNLTVKNNSVEIFSNFQNGGVGEKKWTFNSAGSVVFPDATTQSTAWTGSVDWTNVTSKPVFATVATSGAYSDLSGTPVLATVATSGAYADLSGLPTVYSDTFIGTTSIAFNRASAIQTLNGVSIDGNAGTVTNGVYTTGSYSNPSWITDLAYSKLTGAPALAAVATSGSYADLSGKPVLATVATSGSYTDLSNTPTGLATETYVNNAISNLVDSAPATLNTLNELANALNDDANFATTVTNAIAAKADSSSLAAVATSGAYSDLSGTPVLATVATSGSYDDLSNKPTIPTTLDSLTNVSVGGAGDGNTIIYSTATSEWVPAILAAVAFSGSYSDLGGAPTALSAFTNDTGFTTFSGDYVDLLNKPTIPTATSQLTNDSGYISAETDPTFTSSPAGGITSTQITNWDTAFGWGNHALAGYLTTESDPVFSGSPAGGITSNQITNWDTAYGWGNHASAGYLTTESDPVFSGSPAGGITSNQITNWDTAYGWGNHASAGYLTTESDPTFAASPAGGITSTQVTNWDTAYSWGDHASAGYLTSSSLTNATLSTSLTLGTNASSYSISKTLNSSEVSLERLISGTYTQLVTNASETVNLFTFNTANYSTCRYTIHWYDDSGNVNISEWLVASNGAAVAINEQRAGGTTSGTKPYGTNNAVIAGGVVTVRATTNTSSSAGTVYNYTIHVIQYV